MSVTRVLTWFSTSAHPQDRGPIYAETDMSSFPVEPWNTYSNFLFLGIFIYWSFRTRYNFRQHPLLVAGLPILLVGFIGGTIFHATRSNNIWLILDFVPILILGLLGATYFWHALTKNLIASAVLVFLTLAASWWIRKASGLPIHARISMGYIGLALTVILPASLHCYKLHWAEWKILLMASLSFAIAVVFRLIDRGLGLILLPMGTHFLWHTFGALSTSLLFLYIFRTRKQPSSSSAGSTTP